MRATLLGLLLVVAVCSAWPNVAGEQMHPLLYALSVGRGPAAPSSFVQPHVKPKTFTRMYAQWQRHPFILT